MKSRSIFVRASVGALGGLAGVAAGQGTYAFDLDEKASVVDTDISVRTPLTGHWIGNYDPVNNPTGTETRRGLFGGSGNQTIPISGSISVSGRSNTNPAGTFEIDVYASPDRFAMRGLVLDLLNGATPSIDLTFTIGFSSFRTFRPDSIYFGVPALPIPLGGAQILSLTGTQIEQVPGILEATGPGEWTFAVLVPMTIEGEVEGPTGPLSLPPTPAPIPVTGTLRISPGGASVSIEGGFEAQTVLPAPKQGIENVPFDLPTILPPGEVAHLLLTADFGETDLDVSQSLTIVADGGEVCRADYDRNGELDIFDFIAFQNDFAAMNPKADFDGNGRFEIWDFLLFLNAFAAGCNT